MRALVRSAVLALVATMLASCNPMKGAAAAGQTVDEFHRRLDAGEFAIIYANAHPDLKSTTTEADFIALLDAVHRKLGNVQSAKRTGWNINSHNLKTNFTAQYETKFANGDATETFVIRIEGDKGRLIGYNISSLALITK